MRYWSLILTFLLLGAFHTSGQEANGELSDTFRISGQLSTWLNLNTGSELPLATGGRYIPAMNYGIYTPADKLIDLEVSANLSGDLSFRPFSEADAGALIKPYRAWIRYSGDQLELRLGLQKINFGSATMLRPLMWFDQMDPRDPLRLTDGVWALLGRYYFLNNVNIWLWGLYGNNKPRGWETVPVNSNYPEFGGRIQTPVPGGEAAFTFHHRTADNRGMILFSDFHDRIPEDKFAFDARWDLVTGIWVEGSWTRKGRDLGLFTNQVIINAGMDYTFGIGNGLYASFEQLLFSMDKKAFSLDNRRSLSLASLNYPVGLFDRIGAIVYYDWTGRNVYNFLSWQKQLDNIIFYMMAYWNPSSAILPSGTGTGNMFSGKGLQLMFVFNH